MSDYWQDEEESRPPRGSEDIVDVAFRIQCRFLAVDHACALSQALSAALPWLAIEPRAGVHLIHGAASGNGWQKPAEGSLFSVSSRTRLTLRVPLSRESDVQALTGQRLQVGEHELVVGESRIRVLPATDTLYSHGVLAADEDESRFLALADDGLRELGVHAPRLLPGMSRRLAFPDCSRQTRSLLISGLDPRDAVRVQEQGLGGGRLFGCGLFVPYKKIG